MFGSKKTKVRKGSEDLGTPASPGLFSQAGAPAGAVKPSFPGFPKRTDLSGPLSNRSGSPGGDGFNFRLQRRPSQNESFIDAAAKRKTAFADMSPEMRFSRESRLRDTDKYSDRDGTPDALRRAEAKAASLRFKLNTPPKATVEVTGIYTDRSHNRKYGVRQRHALLLAPPHVLPVLLGPQKGRFLAVPLHHA